MHIRACLKLGCLHVSAVSVAERRRIKMTTAEPFRQLPNQSIAAPTDPDGPTGRLAT